MQEDLEAEFQSLFSLLEELKEGMLMKIKQDRASRTYELQVCVIWGRGWGCSPRPPPRCHPLHTPQSPTGLNIFLRTCSSSLAPSQRGRQCPWCPEPDHPVVSALPSPLPAHDLSIPHAPALPLNPFSPALLQPHPYICCSSPPVFISHFQFFSPSHWSLRSEVFPHILFICE